MNIIFVGATVYPVNNFRIHMCNYNVGCLRLVWKKKRKHEYEKT